MNTMTAETPEPAWLNSTAYLNREAFMKNRTKHFSEVKGTQYAYVLTKHGWRNQGMVADNNRQPFIDEYKAKVGSRVAFVPFCWEDSPNVMTDSDIYSYASRSF